MIAATSQAPLPLRWPSRRRARTSTITNRLLSVSALSLEGHLQEICEFVEKGLSDLQGLLNRDAALAKAELHSHLSEIRMTPTEGQEWHYVAEGTWSLLGTGPNAPVLGLAHSDGCGGQI